MLDLKKSESVSGRCFSLLSSRLLYLIIMPTERCQLRCVYCYEDFVAGRMRRHVRTGLKAWMDRRAPDLELLAIGWFGGEPLLAFDVIEEIQSYAWELGTSWPQLIVRGSMTTNGALLVPARLEHLAGLGVQEYQITLDGPREIHDRLRVTAGGQPTFQSIWENLCGAREVEGEFLIDLRLHVSRENLKSLPAFIDECYGAFGTDPRFRLAVRGLRRLGGPNDSTLPVLDDAAQDRALAGLSDYAESIGFRVDRGPFEGPNPSPGCYAVAGYSYVVRSNGDLAKCTVALRHPRNRVGRLREDGTVALDQAKMAGWTRGVFSGDEQALRCPAVGFADLHDTTGSPESVDAGPATGRGASA